jgi:hypothetical protein
MERTRPFSRREILAPDYRICACTTCGTRLGIDCAPRACQNEERICDQKRGTVLRVWLQNGGKNGAKIRCSTTGAVSG